MKTMIFRFEGDEDVSIRNHDEWGSDGWRWKWEWVSVPRGRSLGKLEELCSVLRDLAPILGYVDSSRWFLASDEVFSIKHIRELIDEKILRAVTYVEETSWCKFVPRKVNVFIWRLKCGRIPVRSILDHIRIDLDSTLCPYCENAVETIDHIMVRCVEAESRKDYIINIDLYQENVFALSSDEQCGIHGSLRFLERVGNFDKLDVHCAEELVFNPERAFLSL
ncbi:RNA-directed DNA polymerase, eukaryota, reverse transcriptase zinc-binding domain protein [Tanacetum coccineum]